MKQAKHWPIDSGSKKHHFVPVHHINHFTDDDGCLWWYDKQYDVFCRTSQKRKHPEGVLYEPDGNTVERGGERTTVVESAFADVDDLSAPLLKLVVNAADLVNGISAESYAYLHARLILQFFRTPANNDYYAALLRVWKENPVEFISSTIVPSVAIEDELVRKSSRFFLPLDLLQRLQRGSSDTRTHRLYPSERPMLVLTDNPVVFLRPIVKVEDLLGPAMLALSKTRLCTVDDPHFETGDRLWRIIAYNIMSIEQAKRWVYASHDSVLKTAIETWKEYRNRGILNSFKEDLYRCR